MENRYFITDVYIPSGTRTLETNLAHIAQEYVNHILSYEAMHRLAERIRAEHDEMTRANKRLRPVDIELDLDGNWYRDYTFFRIGQVSVQFRHIKGELL